MAGTWPTARAAIKTHLDGLTSDLGASFGTETLTAFEWAVPGRQDVANWPYAFIRDSQRRTAPVAGSARVTQADPIVRVMLAPHSYDGNMETLQRRYDAWVEVIFGAFDDAVTLDGTADVWLEWAVGDITLFDDLDSGWGFELTMTGLRITEVKSISA